MDSTAVSSLNLGRPTETVVSSDRSVRVTTRVNKSIVMDLVREYDQNQQNQKQPNNPNKSTQTMHGGEHVCFQTMKVLLTAVVFPALTSLSGKSVASRYT